MYTSDPIPVKRPSSFLEFNFKFTGMPGFCPSDDLLYQIMVPILTDKEPTSGDACL